MTAQDEIMREVMTLAKLHPSEVMDGDPGNPPDVDFSNGKDGVTIHCHRGKVWATRFGSGRGTIRVASAGSASALINQIFAP